MVVTQLAEAVVHHETMREEEAEVHVKGRLWWCFRESRRRLPSLHSRPSVAVVAEVVQVELLFRLTGAQ